QPWIRFTTTIRNASPLVMFNRRSEIRVLEINLTVRSVKNTIKKEDSQPATVGTELIHVSRRFPGSATREHRANHAGTDAIRPLRPNGSMAFPSSLAIPHAKSVATRARRRRGLPNSLSKLH